MRRSFIQESSQGCWRMLKPGLGKPRGLLIAPALAWSKASWICCADLQQTAEVALCGFHQRRAFDCGVGLFLLQKQNILGNFPGLSVKLRRQMVSVGTVASQCLAERGPPSSNFNGGSTCEQTYRVSFLFTKCWMIGSLSWKMVALRQYFHYKKEMNSSKSWL